MKPNTPLQGTAEKLRFSVPSALRAPATPELARWSVYESLLLVPAP